MTRPDERRFVLFPRGHVRDRVILTVLRNGMREMVNPDTGQLFTEDEIARATQEGSRYFLGADGIDLYGQAAQSRAAWFVDQLFPRKASTGYLQDVHQPLWQPDGYLPAAGGIGKVTAVAPAGTIWNGSTTIPDPAARQARDPDGKRYQVYITEVTPAGGTVELTMRGIDGGDASNLDAGTPLTWINAPVGADPEAVVSVDFEGGVNAETDEEFATRVEDAMHYRSGAGNQAQFRAWARSASAAVDLAFVYACGLHAGSVVVCITQKRTGPGPLAKIPTLATLTDVTAYLTPPSSPVVPGNVHVLVVGPSQSASDLSLRFALTRGAAGGWRDIRPWPSCSASMPQALIDTVSDQTHFQILTDVAPQFSLPASGLTAPSMMVWDETSSRFFELNVQSVSLAAPDTYAVVLNAEPEVTLSSGMPVSPMTDRMTAIAESLEQYIDSLGPGELVDLLTDERGHRAYRFPRPTQEAPSKLNFRLISTILEDLGGAAGDGEIFNATTESPPVPTSPSDGPAKIILGQVGIYDVED